MPPAHTTSKSQETQIAESCFALAAGGHWADLSFKKIAEKAGVPEKKVAAVLQDKNKIPAFLIGIIDDAVEKEIDTTNLPTSIHDRLFEILMARFDLLQARRKGVIALGRLCRQTPDLVPLVIKAHWNSTGKVLALAQIPRDDSALLLVKLSLLFCFHLTYTKWERDHTADMAPTMSFLDRALRRLPLKD